MKYEEIDFVNGALPETAFETRICQPPAADRMVAKTYDYRQVAKRTADWKRE